MLLLTTKGVRVKIRDYKQLKNSSDAIVCLATVSTYSYWESHDLIDYVSYADSLIDSDKKIILHGTSFGGATVGIAFGNPIVNEKADIAILDSPLSAMKLALSLSMEQMDIKLPVWYLLSVG